MPKKTENTENTEKNESSTGKYVYDKKIKKVVKVSDEITSTSGSDSHGGCCGGHCNHG